jgi:para-nitrobenzyl esterase
LRAHDEDRRTARGVGAAPVYFYYLVWKSPALHGRLESPHALDIPFVFDNTQRSVLTGHEPRALALADKLSDAWIAFARTGNPDTEKLPPWQPYDGARRATLVIDDHSAMVDDPNRPRREIMQRALGLE